MKQAEFNFARTEHRHRYVTYSEADARYLDACKRGELKITESFLIESRAQRIRCTEFDLRMMRNWELARELADEESIVLQRDSEFIAPAFIDWDLIDALAKRETKERMEAFERFVQSEKKALKG